MKIFKIVVDIALLILTFLLENMNITGNLLHEILGTSIGILLIIHILNNRRWVASVTKNFKIVNKKTKLMYITNILICLVYFGTIIVGILISNELFHFHIGGYILALIHLILGRLAVIFMLIHLGLHLNLIFKNIKNKKLVYIVYIIISILISGYSIYKLTTSFEWTSVFRRNTIMHAKVKEEINFGKTTKEGFIVDSSLKHNGKTYHFSSYIPV